MKPEGVKIKVLRSLFFRSKTAEGCAAKIYVTEYDESVLIRKVIVSKECAKGFRVIRKFKDYWILSEQILLKHESMFNVCRILYDETIKIKA